MNSNRIQINSNGIQYNRSESTHDGTGIITEQKFIGDEGV